jgi:NAD(P)-dependent dehydrogenase (short-subunit alcohol dehydrogenase family)
MTLYKTNDSRDEPNIIYTISLNVGRIVNASSARGWYRLPGDTVYQTSKFGLEMMTDSLRLEMIKFGVVVSVVEPARYDASTSCSSPKMVNHTYFIIQIVYRREGNVSIIYANILLSKQSSLRWCTGKRKRQKKHITTTVTTKQCNKHAYITVLNEYTFKTEC